MEKGQGKGTDTLQTDNVFTRKEYIEREEAIDALQNHYEVRNAVQNGIMDECVMLMLRVPAADVVNKNEFVRETVDYLNRHAALEHGDVKLGFEKAIAAIALMPTEPIKIIKRFAEVSEYA